MHTDSVTADIFKNNFLMHGMTIYLCVDFGWCCKLCLNKSVINDNFGRSFEPGGYIAQQRILCSGDAC